MKKFLPIFFVFFFAFVFTPGTHAYSTQDGGIYDNQGESLQLRGVNWFGFETNDHAFHGLWARNIGDMVEQMKDSGFNAVRVPFCPAVLEGASVSSINFSLNPELEGMNALEILDYAVELLDEEGMYILLDHHRPDCQNIPDLWYTSSYSEDDWIEDLVFVANRYEGVGHFLGIDLKNEPHGTATWGTGNTSTDWNTAAEKAADAILEANDDLLIFVEGIQESSTCSNSIAHWWGGSFEPLACEGLDIDEDHLVLSPHVYGPDVWMQSYFSASDFPNNMPAIWEEHFGYLRDQGYTVAIGEFGGRYGHGGNSLDVTWQDAFVDYMIDADIAHSFYWSWNPNSGDTGGILQDDWTAVHQDKLDLLERLWEGTEAEEDEETSTTFEYFDDVSGHWAEEAIYTLAEADLVEGYSDRRFLPDQNINRAEAAMLLVRYFEKKAGVLEDPFATHFYDVSLSDWFGDAVNQLAEIGLVRGYEDDSYRPSSAINRAEFATLMYRTFLLFEQDFEGTHAGLAGEWYADVLNADWYAEAASELTFLGIVEGVVCGQHRCFDGGRAITRAEAAMILYRLEKLL